MDHSASYMLLNCFYFKFLITPTLNAHKHSQTNVQVHSPHALICHCQNEQVHVSVGQKPPFSPSLLFSDRTKAPSIISKILTKAPPLKDF